MYDEPNWRPRPDRNRRLSTEIALRNLIARTRHIVLRGHTDRLNKIALSGQRELGAHPKQGRKRHAFQQRPCMKIDLVLEPDIAGGIGCWHIVDP